MDDSTSEHFTQSDSPSLTPHERAAGRLALQARMALSLTAEEKTDIRRALQHAVYEDPVPVRRWSMFRLPVRVPAMAFAVLLLLGASGRGLTYAAESSLPGDAFYPVKVHVIEVIRAKFLVSPEDRARWAVERLQRRMDEVRILKAHGVADEQIDIAIGDALETVASSVQAEVDALPATAAERAAMRTAVHAAIGTDHDSLRRASKVNRVLNALMERADGFDAMLREHIGGNASTSIDGDSSSAARSSAPTSSAQRSRAQAVSSSPDSEPLPDEESSPLPAVDAPGVDVPDLSVPDVVDGLL